MNHHHATTPRPGPVNEAEYQAIYGSTTMAKSDTYIYMDNKQIDLDGEIAGTYDKHGHGFKPEGATRFYPVIQRKQTRQQLKQDKFAATAMMLAANAESSTPRTVDASDWK